MKVLSPNSLTYAQALQVIPSHPRITNSTVTDHNNPTTGTLPTKDTIQPSIARPTYARSPRSPTMLHFPPSPNYREWWGKCFRCTRKCHIAAECKYPCWHPCPTVSSLTGQSSHSSLTPTAAPFTPAIQHKSKRPRTEPSFDEFLAEPEPQQDHDIPLDRPRKVHCYFNRDEQYFQTLDEMLRGVVVQPPDHLLGAISLDQIATAIAVSGKVLPNQLQVALISTNKFLVLLSPNLNREELVVALPKRI